MTINFLEFRRLAFGAFPMPLPGGQAQGEIPGKKAIDRRMKSFVEWMISESLANQELPPDPGSVAVPNGHVRLYHQTDENKADSIRKNGIQRSYSTGNSLKEPVVIWATENPYYGDVYKPGVATVEFFVPVCDNSMKFPCFMSPTYVAGEVVPPESILAIHEYWHSIARQLISDYSELDHKTVELMNLFKDIDEDHKKAVEYYLSRMSLKFQ